MGYQLKVTVTVSDPQPTPVLLRKGTLTDPLKCPPEQESASAAKVPCHSLEPNGIVPPLLLPTDTVQTPLRKVTSTLSTQLGSGDPLIA